MNFGRRLIAGAGILAILAVVAFAIHGGRTAAEDLPPNTARFFASASDDVRLIASQIEAGAVPDDATVAALGPRMNERYEDGMTLLFFTLLNKNIAAAGPLLRAGVDPSMRGKPDGESPDFLALMIYTGGTAISAEELDELVRTYLQSGGDPNALINAGEGRSLLSSALISLRYRAARDLIETGADFWDRRNQVGSATYGSSAVREVGFREEATAFVNWAIDKGLYTDLAPEALSLVMYWLASPGQRGDAVTEARKQVAMRILKRNPGYQPPADPDREINLLFRSGPADDRAAEIPWDLILSDAVD